jgi:hypothetical protein
MSVENVDEAIKRLVALGVNEELLQENRQGLVGAFGEERGTSFFIRILGAIEGYDRMAKTTFHRAAPRLNGLRGSLPDELLADTEGTLNVLVTSTGNFAQYVFKEIERDKGLLMSPQQFERELRDHLEAGVQRAEQKASTLPEPLLT